MADNTQAEFGALRKRYEPVRPIVKETVKEELAANPNADRKTAQRSAFRAVEKAYPLIYRDALTNLYNKKWFDEELQRRLARINREITGGDKNLQFNAEGFEANKKIFLVLIDIDKFKTINDAYGHSIGDEALKLISAIHTRQDEPIARYGGEEFAQLVEIPEDVSDENVEQIFQTITSRQSTQLGLQSQILLKDIPKQENYAGEEPQRQITLSYGITRILPGDTSETVKKRADFALYKAKNEGRNRAVLAQTAFVTDREANLYFKNVYASSQAA